MTSPEPDPMFTALEAVRVCLRGGTADEIAQTITAELNEVNAGGLEIVSHALTATANCAQLCTAVIERLANDTQQNPDTIYAQLRGAFMNVVEGEPGESTA